MTTNRKIKVNQNCKCCVMTSHSTIPRLIKLVLVINNKVKVYFQNEIVMEGFRNNNFCYLGYRKIKESKFDLNNLSNKSKFENVQVHVANQIAKSQSDYLIHSRLGQPSLKTMKQLGIINESKLVETKFCNECVISKSTRKAFKTHLNRNFAKNLLDQLHFDLCSVNNYYGLGIIDEFNRKAFIRTVKSK